jgi:hypothetical protein
MQPRWIAYAGSSENGTLVDPWVGEVGRGACAATSARAA